MTEMGYFKIKQTIWIEKAKNIDKYLTTIYAPLVISVSRQLYHLLSADINLGAIFLKYLIFFFFWFWLYSNTF